MVLPVVPETELEHDTDLPAAESLVPAVTFTLAISVAGYVIVHSTLAGCAPPDVVIPRARLVLPPCDALPEPNVSAACCARTGNWRKRTAKPSRFNDVI
jgi:hypothetical protein